jgi:hypothetical protein
MWRIGDSWKTRQQLVGQPKASVMQVDFFENGLCFYCHLAKNELLIYRGFNSETEQSWKQKEDLLETEIDSIIAKFPEADPYDIVESHGWDLHLHQFTYPDIHRTALVIGIYVFLEDQLNGLCHTIGESMKMRLDLADLGGKGIERALLFLSKVAEFNLQTISSISFRASCKSFNENSLSIHFLCTFR